MRDKIKKVLDNYYNVNMFNEHMRQTIATEIEKALTGETTVDKITVPVEEPMEVVENPVKVEEKVKKPTKKPKKSVNSRSLKNLANRSSILNEKKEKNKKNRSKGRTIKKSR